MILPFCTTFASRSSTVQKLGMLLCHSFVLQKETSRCTRQKMLYHENSKMGTAVARNSVGSTLEAERVETWLWRSCHSQFSGTIPISWPGGEIFRV